MARPGIGADKIIEIIRELEATGREPTATAVREQLGSGSYSTIAAVLADWRREKTKDTGTPIPEPPDSVRHVLSHLWGEAWKAALAVHEPERQAFARARAEHEQTASEMTAEITRLEGELVREKEQSARTLQGLQAELTALAQDRDLVREEFQAARAALATAEGALAEARTQLEREAKRNEDLSQRVITEAAKAQALAARVAELERAKQ